MSKGDTHASHIDHSFMKSRHWSYQDTSLTLTDSAAQSSDIAAALESAVDINLELFGTAPKKLQVTVVRSPDEWRAHAAQYRHLEFAWGLTLDDGSITIKSPEFSGIDFERFSKVLTHEVNHAFWVEQFGRHGAGWTPNWVVEGLANFAAAARELFPPDETALAAQREGLNATALEFYYRDMSGPEELIHCYSLWRAVIAHLFEQGGRAHLMTTLLEFTTAPPQSILQTASSEIIHSRLMNFLRVLLIALAAEGSTHHQVICSLRHELSQITRLLLGKPYFPKTPNPGRAVLKQV